MSVNSDIRDGIRAICKGLTGNDSAFSAEVLTVDMASRTCSVLSYSDEVETEFTNVWLMPEIADGVLYKPTIGSTVIVQNNSNLQPYIVMWSAIDGVYYVVNNTTFSMTDGHTKFNAGSNGGLINVAPLVSKINALENLINDLITKYNTHTHPFVWVSPGATSTISATTSLETGNIAPVTARADIEDTAVTH